MCALVYEWYRPLLQRICKKLIMILPPGVRNCGGRAEERGTDPPAPLGPHTYAQMKTKIKERTRVWFTPECVSLPGDG